MDWPGTLTWPSNFFFNFSKKHNFSNLDVFHSCLKKNDFLHKEKISYTYLKISDFLWLRGKIFFPNKFFFKLSEKLISYTCTKKL